MTTADIQCGGEAPVKERTAGLVLASSTAFVNAGRKRVLGKDGDEGVTTGKELGEISGYALAGKERNVYTHCYSHTVTYPVTHTDRVSYKLQEFKTVVKKTQFAHNP